jgi:transcriptional regulator with XRE-family HTH domain
MATNLDAHEVAAIKARLKEAVTRVCRLSWYQFAKAAGFSHATTSDWRNPKKEALPGAPHLTGIVKRFGVSIDWLLTGEGGELRGTLQPKRALAQELRAWVIADVERLYSIGDAKRGLLEELLPQGEDLLDSLVRDGNRRLTQHYEDWSAGMAPKLAKKYLRTTDPKQKRFVGDWLARAVLHRRPIANRR